MDKFANITNTEGCDSPSFIRAQQILRYEANLRSALKKLNREISGTHQLSTPIPKHIPVKRKIKIDLSSLLP